MIFGFSNKKNEEKVYKSFILDTNEIVTKYFFYREIKKSTSDSDSNDNKTHYVDACYVLGLIFGIQAFVDAKQKYINDAILKDIFFDSFNALWLKNVKKLDLCESYFNFINAHAEDTLVGNIFEDGMESGYTIMEELSSISTDSVGERFRSSEVYEIFKKEYLSDAKHENKLAALSKNE